MKIINYILAGIITFSLLTSCEEVDGLLEDTNTDLTTEEVVDGLKKALEVGTDTATKVLSVQDGYFRDELVKILLPEDVQSKLNNAQNIANELGVSNYFDLEAQVDSVILSINRAAEDAAKEATPVFKNAITDMSISDAWDILNGTNPAGTTKSTLAFDSTAATEYFKAMTTMELTNIFGGKIDVSLDKDLGLGFSANYAYDLLVTNYNNAVDLAQPLLTWSNYSIEKITTTSIGEHCTAKALDGLYFRVGKEERKIRRHPFQYISDIIQRVFGSLLD